MTNSAEVVAAQQEVKARWRATTCEEVGQSLYDFIKEGEGVSTFGLQEEPGDCNC